MAGVKHIDTHIEMDFMMVLAIMVVQQVMVSLISMNDSNQEDMFCLECD